MSIKFKIITAIIAVIAITYFSFSLGVLSLNILDWHIDIRSAFASVMGFLLMCVVLVALLVNKDCE